MTTAKEQEAPKIMRKRKPTLPKLAQELIKIVASDSAAITFQSLGQYRTWLIGAMEKQAEDHPKLFVFVVTYHHDQFETSETVISTSKWKASLTAPKGARVLDVLEQEEVRDGLRTSRHGSNLRNWPPRLSDQTAEWKAYLQERNARPDLES